MGVFSIEPQKGLDHIQTAYVQKDNPIEVVLKEDNKEYDFSTATAIRAKIGNVVIDSEAEADAWAELATLFSEAEADAFDRSESQIGRLKIFIGDQTIEAKAYNVKVEIDDADGRTLYFGHVRVKIEDTGM